MIEYGKIGKEKGMKKDRKDSRGTAKKWMDGMGRPTKKRGTDRRRENQELRELWR